MRIYIYLYLYIDINTSVLLFIYRFLSLSVSPFLSYLYFSMCWIGALLRHGVVTDVKSCAFPTVKKVRSEQLWKLTVP